MLNHRLEKELNKQVNAELYSAYLYLSMSAYFESINLPGAASWTRVQAEEEQFHAMKIFDFINERGGRAKLVAIESPPVEWDGIVNVFEEILKHEQHVTSLIYNLMDIATEEKDYATTAFLQWFITEQVEEEASVTEMLNKLQLIGGKGHGLLMLDKELAQRTFVPPAAN
ncbi:MAG: ferritin [Alkaliphilus sp.]|nr:ferritin [bacterium AH-315-E09]PHS35075.1 MAG: ferritin [Alkaliphilus sp.]